MSEIKKVLIVEDDDATRQVVRLTLAGHFEIVEVSSAMEALALLENSHIDGIISDYQMPTMNGLEFVGKLRVDHRWNKLPVVMMSGSLTTEIVSKAIAAGVFECLSKPFHPRTLVDVMHKSLSGLR